MTKKLTKKDIAKLRKNIGSAWSVSATATSLDRSFTFSSFIEAFMFVTRVGVHAEVMQDYPHIEIDQAVVQLALKSTTSAGLTVAQFEFAEKIDVVYALSTNAAKRHHAGV
jgi:4a-hydroxytetrahydrobiopterin dehydratase